MGTHLFTSQLPSDSALGAAAAAADTKLSAAQAVAVEWNGSSCRLHE